MSNFSFIKGYNQVQHKDLLAVRAEILTVLGLNSISNWYFRLKGKVRLQVSEK